LRQRVARCAEDDACGQARQHNAHRLAAARLSGEYTVSSGIDILRVSLFFAIHVRLAPVTVASSMGNGGAGIKALYAHGLRGDMVQVMGNYFTFPGGYAQ
jgi:hypothetical protein